MNTLVLALAASASAKRAAEVEEQSGTETAPTVNCEAAAPGPECLYTPELVHDLVSAPGKKRKIKMKSSSVFNWQQ